MPFYDFRCSACQEIFEVTRPMSVRGDETCPACGGVATKVFAPVGVAFKGSGFHNTDYKPRPKEEAGPPAPCPAKGDSPGCASCPSAS